MTVFIHDDCKWLATGEVVCRNGKKLNVLEGFADMAALGEKCNNATCSKGVCFKEKNSPDAFCKNVLFTNQMGCATTEHSACVQGLNCVDDTCVNPLTKTTESQQQTAPTTPTTPTTPTVQVTKTTSQVTSQPSKLVQAPETAPATKEEKVATTNTSLPKWVSKLQSIDYRKAVMYTLICLVIYILFMMAFYIGRMSASQAPSTYSSYSY